MEILVCEKLKIKEPTNALIGWCKNNLVIQNPEFYKRQQMGKWTGGTSEYIWMYERVGDELHLPFGCIEKIWHLWPVKDAYKLQICPLRHVEYKSRINLYEYQEKAAQEAIKAKNGILVMPCGSGKTQCGLEIIARIGGRALWLTHTHDLLMQSKERAISVLEGVKCGTITAGKVDIGEHITFATVQTMAKIDLSAYRDAFDIIIVDECMPAETLIDTPAGKRELKNLCIDDIITSYNRNTKKLEYKRVKHVFKYKAHDIVKIKLSNGEEIICTSNHPIFTKDGRWIDAERLVHDDYVLRLVWERSGNRHNAQNIKTQGIGARLLLLLKRMFCKGWSQKRCLDRRSQESRIRNNEKNKQSVSRSVCGAYEKKQSDEKAGSAKSGIGQAERNRTQATDKMWEWCGADCSTTKTDACTCERGEHLCGISNTNKNGKRFWISDLLQGGHSNSREYDCNRGGWRFASDNRAAETGYKERAVFEWVRVDNVEVQEQTSDGTFGGLCSDGYVYNIEVEDNNNYFANGILVHNCQHCCGTPSRVTMFYKVVSSLCARYKFGLTATPKRSDGLQACMFALLGDKIHEVTKEEVAHTTCPVQVQQIDTGWMPDYDEILMGDGTIDYHKVIDSMIHDNERFDVVWSTIAGLYHAGAVMVLANRVEYLQQLCDAYNKGQAGMAVCLSGMGQSKKAKAERKAALEKLNNGELDCVFCTYQLAAEGLDVPNLRYVVFATPEKNDVTVTQATGRVGRKAEGKECGTVIDFVDDFCMYKNWASIRRGYYRKINAEIL